MTTSSRTYRSELRQQQAERTRELIAAAARAEFLATGWAGTSVRSVARRAGVSEATVYHAYGSKAGLASSLVDAAERSADVRRAVAELAEHAGGPARQLLVFVAFDRRLFEQGGDVLRLLAEARRQHPELAAAYAEGQARGDAERRAVFSTWPRRAWRRGVDVDHALTVYALVVSLSSYECATTERGWTPDQVEQWYHATLVELLLAPGTA
jgi:AcrR family transcriptional regulator